MTCVVQKVRRYRDKVHQCSVPRPTWNDQFSPLHGKLLISVGGYKGSAAGLAGVASALQHLVEGDIDVEADDDSGDPGVEDDRGVLDGLQGERVGDCVGLGVSGVTRAGGGQLG